MWLGQEGQQEIATAARCRLEIALMDTLVGGD